jgi:Cu+-exporting ATPase
MAQVKDPVCGMMIDSSSAAASSEHGGMTHYFCSAACKQKFDANPSAYAGSMKH